MKAKRILSSLVVVGLLAGLLSSCSSLFGPPPTPTRPPLPATNPLLLERSPSRGEEAQLDAPITLVFDQPMDQPATEAAFSLEPSMEGTFSWADSTTLLFTPASDWDRAARYGVKIDASAKSDLGLELRDEINFTFATVGFLEVAQVIPEPDSTEIEPDAVVTVMFNRPVVPLQLVSAPVSDMPDPLSFQPPVEGTGEWVNTSIYLFRPETGFVPGRVYEATVRAGLEDTTGGILEEGFSWSFGVQSPYVLWTEPGDGEEMVPLTQPITVTFSQAMEHSSAEAAFSLRSSGGDAMSGSFIWSDDSTEVTFFPSSGAGSSGLQLGTFYSCFVGSSARAATGDASLREGYRWDFVTVPYPSIVETDPVDGEINADPETSLRIYFSAPMDVSTLMSNITILPEPTQVYTYWS